MKELVRRQSANESSLDRVDLSRIALAGFDLDTLRIHAGRG